MPCVEQVIAQTGKAMKAETRLYQKRNYAQGKKMKQKEYFYLRLAEIKNDCRKQLQRLRIEDVWIEELLEHKASLVSTKQSFGGETVQDLQEEQQRTHGSLQMI